MYRIDSTESTSIRRCSGVAHLSVILAAVVLVAAAPRDQAGAPPVAIPQLDGRPVSTVVIRRLYAAYNRSALASRPHALWFTDDRGQVFVAAVDRTINAFRIEHVPAEQARDAVAKALARVAASETKDGVDPAVVRDIVDSLKATFPAYDMLTHAAEGVMWQYFGSRAGSAPLLRDQLQELLGASALDEVEPTGVPQVAGTAPPPVASPARAVQPAARSASQAGRVTAALSADALNTSGLTHGTTIAHVYAGQFAEIEFDRDNPMFLALFQQYLVAFGTQCTAQLPDNKVEMTSRECAAESVTRNGFGTEIDRTCVRWRDVPTGIFADPTLYNVRRSLDAREAQDAGRRLSQAFGTVARPDGLTNTARLLSAAVAFKSDMASLVSRNACDGAALRRLEQNIVRFAQSQPPLRLDGSTAGSALQPAPGEPYVDQNYDRFLADLVADDARQWGAFARLIPGSVLGARVTSRDASGRPKEITASYAHENLFGRQQGQVTVTFTDGVPQCVVYSETGVCHDPNRRIVAAFLDGKYR